MYLEGEFFDSNSIMTHEVVGVKKKTVTINPNPEIITTKPIDAIAVEEAGLLTPEATPEPSDSNPDLMELSSDPDPPEQQEEDTQAIQDIEDDGDRDFFDVEEEIQRDSVIANVANTRRSARTAKPLGYYKILNTKGIAAANTLPNNVFVDLDQFEPEDHEFILVALEN